MRIRCVASRRKRIETTDTLLYFPERKKERCRGNSHCMPVKSELHKHPFQISWAWNGKSMPMLFGWSVLFWKSIRYESLFLLSPAAGLRVLFFIFERWKKVGRLPVLSCLSRGKRSLGGCMERGGAEGFRKESFRLKQHRAGSENSERHGFQSGKGKKISLSCIERDQAVK